MTGSLRLPVRPWPLLLFGGLAGLLLATEYYAVHRADLQGRSELPPAVACDLLVVLPGLFYWLVVRPYRLPVSTVAAAFGFGLVLSHWLLPTGALPLLAWAGWLALAAEAGVLGYTCRRLRRVGQAYRAARQRSPHFLENLHAACQPALGRLGPLLATEAAVLRYALLGAWAAPEVGVGERPFSTYRQSGFGALLATLGGLSVVELGAAHLVLAHWHPAAAWVLTVASGYSLLWLLAHGQAVRRRPVLLTQQALVVRVGFCWRAAINLAHIQRVRLLGAAPPAAPDLLNAARLLLTPPNVLLTLAVPQVVLGPFGLRRVVSRLAFYVDEPGELAQQLVAGWA